MSPAPNNLSHCGLDFLNLARSNFAALKVLLLVASKLLGLSGLGGARGPGVVLEEPVFRSFHSFRALYLNGAFEISPISCIYILRLLMQD